ncbi:uncharacterized protein LOC129961658 isoform X2 [Argiope bruennichi]|uniref:uncharacterized protein LOC129961658 isoform X2 n=1 Tax=Argiope bruennichi TaxID=94029 RepID=UPI0024958DD6|nr:uncharacterized protein LOC129961658 isoform X2 [Argiope bruennichi]
MAILKTCCCWKSVRDGSFACGIYTMIFYTLFVTFGTFHLTPEIENKVLFGLGLLALCVSGMCVMSSALLLVGLCADNRTFLIPWLVCVSMATLLDVFLCIYLTAKDSSDPLHSLLFITDFFFSALNVYCLLCVISQYQEYTAGRGRPEDCIRMEAEPNAQCLRFHWPSFQVLNQPPADQERAQEGTSDGNFLTVPGAQANPLNKCHKSSESINSCAKNTTSVQSTDEAIEAV